VSDKVGGRTGLTTSLVNVSEITGENEVIELSTTQLRDEQVLYVIGVAPSADSARYSAVFQRIRRDLQIND
jgi:hypothetical protein